jgi:hypothetical protein
MGDKGIEIVYGVDKNILLGQPEQPRQNIVHRHDKPNEPTKKGPLLFVLFESPFTSVSTVSRGHPSPVSLAGTQRAARLYSIKEVEMRKVNRQTENPRLSYMALFLHQLLDVGGGGNGLSKQVGTEKDKKPSHATVPLKWDEQRRPVVFSS